MITTANYILKATVGGEEYFFEYDTDDMWDALEEFWHEDYPELLIHKEGNAVFNILVRAMERSKVIATYHAKFCHAFFHAFFDKGHTVNGTYTLDDFARDIQFGQSKNKQDYGK